MENQKELVSKLAAMLDGNESLAQNLFEQASKIGIKMQTGEELGLKETTEEVNTKPVIEPVAEPVAEPVTKSVTEPVTKSVAEPVVKEPVTQEAPAEKEVVKDFVLELDLPTIQTLAQEVAQRIPTKETVAEDMQKQLKTMASQLDSVGAILNQLLKTDEDKLADMQKQLPRMRLAYRPSSEPETITTEPKEVATEKALPVESSVNQSLADSIQTIQKHRHNLRIVA